MHWFGYHIVGLLEWLKLKTGALLRDKEGVSTLEYALIAVAVLGVVGGALATMGDQMKALFDALETDITKAVKDAKEADE